ncbi:hypothetical protein NQZ68_008721 [Dissostichus eleginoides]|nr:hypothetical protein NQZ68_008721 [Dissostichus eleginoides]
MKGNLEAVWSLSEYDMREFSSWVGVIIDLSRTHSDHNVRLCSQVHSACLKVTIQASSPPAVTRMTSVTPAITARDVICTASCLRHRLSVRLQQQAVIHHSRNVPVTAEQRWDRSLLFVHG